MNIGYHSNFMDRIIERADKRQERMEKMINKMLDKSEPILNAGKPKPMTNEEYLRTTNVDDMATMIATKLLELARHEYGMCDVVDRDIVLEWLKEKHE